MNNIQGNKLLNKYGSKERLFELMRGVNKLSINEANGLDSGVDIYDKTKYIEIDDVTDQYIETLRASANANTNNDVFLNTGVKVALVNGWLGASRELVVTLVSPYTSSSLREASINLIENINQVNGLIFAKISDEVRWINI